MPFDPARTPGTSSILDGPPPSPQAEGGGPTGQPAQMASMQGLAQPIGAGQMPPEMLAGAMDAAASAGSVLDALSQTFPEFAMDFGIVKDSLQRVMAKVLAAGGGAGPNNASPGSSFPGGGYGPGGPTAGVV